MIFTTNDVAVTDRTQRGQMSTWLRLRGIKTDGTEIRYIPIVLKGTKTTIRSELVRFYGASAKEKLDKYKGNQPWAGILKEYLDKELGDDG